MTEFDRVMSATKKSTSWKVIYNAPRELQPRERMKMVSSAEELATIPDEVLLACIMRSGVKGTNVLEAAMKLRSSCVTLAEFLKYPTLRSFMAFLEERKIGRIGIGEDKVLGLIAAFELGRRAVDAERNMRNRAMPIRGAADVFALLKPEADKQEREVFWCLMLDLRKRLIANPVVVSAGTKDAALVIPRDVFRPAIREGAVAIIAAHNHLSEDISPSDEDIELTRLLKETGDTVGIPLIDHVILSSIPSCCKWGSIVQNRISSAP